MISTAGSVSVAVNTAIEYGAKSVIVMATHPVFWLTVGYGGAIIVLGLVSTGARARKSALRVAPLLQ